MANRLGTGARDSWGRAGLIEISGSRTEIVPEALSTNDPQVRRPTSHSRA